jgi:hypothetical protein
MARTSIMGTSKLYSLGRIVLPRDLINGKRYWLGACSGIYDKHREMFTLGNGFVALEVVYRVFEILDDPEEVSENE